LRYGEAELFLKSELDVVLEFFLDCLPVRFSGAPYLIRQQTLLISQVFLSFLQGDSCCRYLLVCFRFSTLPFFGIQPETRHLFVSFAEARPLEFDGHALLLVIPHYGQVDLSFMFWI